MAAGVLSEPGGEHGPCVVRTCGHRDCDAVRAIADARCPHCGEPIGYDRRFYAGPAGGEATQAEHALCLEQKIEAEQKARA